MRVHCGGWSAIGLWDARSAIAVRVFSRYEPPDAHWMRERVADAWALRESLREDGATTAYRWMYGESDGVPGIVVDLYGEYAVIQTSAESLDTLMPWVVSALRDSAPLQGILKRSRNTSSERDIDTSDRLQCLWGTLPPRDLTVRENKLTFRANLFAGQKTGLFLDQRDNRNTVRSWSSGRRVLNCFSYTGAFSVYAAAGGASSVVSCDVAAGAMEDAHVNMSLNQLDSAAQSFVVEDCFDLLNQYNEEGRLFDLIILDPPSFARSKQQVYAALRAYTRLNALALRCVAPGGLLATASCTSQVSPDLFRNMLADAAAQAERRLVIMHDAAQPIDHPVPVHFPEGRYLKFILGAVHQLI